MKHPKWVKEYGERGGQRVEFASRSHVDSIYVLPMRFQDLFPNGVINYFTGKLESIIFGNSYLYLIYPETRYLKQKSTKGKMSNWL